MRSNKTHSGSGKIIFRILTAVIFVSLFTACASSEARAARRGDLASVREFIEAGGDVNERQKGGMTLLMYASSGGQVPTIDYLVSVGADVHMRDDRGFSALMHGASAGKKVSIVSLLAYGARINDRNSGGETSLIMAASRDYSDVVRTLLDNGADYTVQDKSGWTAILAALNKSASYSSGLKRSYTLLSSAGAEIDINSSLVPGIAFNAAGKGNQDVLDLLFEKGLDPHIHDANGNTLLHSATVHFEIILFLLNHDLDVNSTNHAGETPLILAVKKGAGQSVTLLLDRGAGIEMMDNQGKTALLYAAQVSDPSIVRTLIERGANVFFTDKKGNTALHLASARSDTESVRLLLISGIYINSYNADGETPYTMSFANQYYGEPIRTLLVKAGAEVPELSTSLAQADPAAPEVQASQEDSAENHEMKNVPLFSDEKETSSPPAAPLPVPVSPVVPSAPPAPVPETSPVNAESDSDPVPEVVSYSIRFSWPKITPSKAKGWNNRDKISGNAVLLLQYAGSSDRIFSERLSIPLKGVNAEAFYTDRSVTLEKGRELEGSLIIETQRGRRLIGSVIGDALQNDRVEFYFDSFEYE